jgi:hypothetical protein
MSPLAALKLAIQHIDHMAAWIAKANSDYHVGVYSFESLGEDMPGIREASDKPLAYVSEMTGRFLSEDMQRNLLDDSAFVGPGDFGPLGTLTSDVYLYLEAARAIGDDRSIELFTYLHERICRARHEISGDPTRELPPRPMLTRRVSA